jgi:multisubunit Na+/H+ antiporter MnhB subunit
LSSRTPEAGREAAAAARREGRRSNALENLNVALWVVVMLVALALAFDFMNGFHDAANSIATVVSTGVLKPHQAVRLPPSSTWWRSRSSS